MKPSRYRFALVVLVAGFVLGLNNSAFSQSKPAFTQEELNVPGPLGDVVLGKADAKVTIIEYASLTCSHCAAFHKDVLPLLKTNYIDTGKVRFILREFPLDALATAGFMLARCDGDKNYYPVSDLLFEQQKNWAFVDRPSDAMAGILRQAGFSQEKFEGCLKDQKLLDGVRSVKNKGLDTFGVNSTPTFFVNGQILRGATRYEDLEKVIKSQIGE